MEPLTMALIGGGLMAGGGILGGFGQRSRRKALERLAARAKEDYRGLGDEYQGLFEPILAQYTQERAANVDLYRSEMNRARTDFETYFEQARTQYGQGMDKALSELRTGRESTIALQRQQTERAQQRASAANAFSGLGQTTFGQQRLEAIGNQGVLQEGAIREQYAGQLSAMEAARAQGLSTLSAQMGQGLSGIQQSMATNLSNIFQSYAGNIANMRTGALGSRMGLIQQGYGIAYQNQGQAANLAGGMTSALGSALGSFGGAMFGAGLSGMTTPQPAQGFSGDSFGGQYYSNLSSPPSNYSAGVNTGQVGTYGGMAVS